MDLENEKRCIFNIIIYMRTIEKIPHFYWTKKKISIAKDIIDKHAPKGATILDPFLGSASSLFATDFSKYSFVGLDINQMPVEMAKSLIKGFSHKDLAVLTKRVAELSKKYEKIYAFTCPNCNKSSTYEKVNIDFAEKGRTISQVNSIIFSCSHCGLSYEKTTSLNKKNLAEQYIEKFNLYAKKNARIEDKLLMKNSRIAVKENMYLSHIFSPMNFFILNDIRSTVVNDELLRYVLASILQLLKYTDEKSQSQFPYWVPEKSVIDRNIFLQMHKKIRDLSNHVDLEKDDLYASQNDTNEKIRLYCTPAQNISNYIQDKTIDLLITDPPYFDQVAYSEYLAIWEYFLDFKTNLKEEIVVSNRSIMPSLEKEYLDNLKKAFIAIHKTLKENAKIFIYFKDSKPKNVTLFMEVMTESGFVLLDQMHIDKKSYSYKQNTTDKTTSAGDCILNFARVEDAIVPEKNNISLKTPSGHTFRERLTTIIKSYLFVNGAATTGELLDNVVFKNPLLSSYVKNMSSNKEVLSLLEENFNYKDKKWSISPKNKLDVVLYSDALDFLRSLPSASVDACITDPPYNISGYDNKKEIGWLKSNSYWSDTKKFDAIDANWDKFSNDDFEKFTLNYLSELKRVIKPNGNIAIFGSYHNIYKIGYFLEKLDLKIVNSIIWYKRNAFPNVTQRMFCESTEQVIWAVNNSQKKATNWTFNYDLMKEFNSGKQMRNMWDIPNTPSSQKKHGKHPSQKNEEVVERLVLALTEKGNTIVDPFGGSGTTAFVAKKNGRKFLTSDNNWEYIEIMKKRLGED